MDQLPFSRFTCLYVQPRNHLPTGMEITPYNRHLKAPFFPVVFVVKQRILCRFGAFALIQSILRGFCEGWDSNAASMTCPWFLSASSVFSVVKSFRFAPARNCL